MDGMHESVSAATRESICCNHSHPNYYTGILIAVTYCYLVPTVAQQNPYLCSVGVPAVVGNRVCSACGDV